MTASAPTQCAQTRLHRQIASFNQQRLRPGLSTLNWQQQLEDAHQHALLEGDFIEAERAAFAQVHPLIPDDADEFLEWFSALKVSGPGQSHPLFAWLGAEASREEMKWFLMQEVSGEAGFDDLVAVTQVRMPVAAKLEMARNYWDELGRGRQEGMHGGLLDRLVVELDLKPCIEDTVWQSLALANLMVALALNRRYAWQSVGALGVVEMTAPGRVSLVNAGLKRLHLPPAARAYFQLHAGLDVRHSEAWNAEVIRPLVAANPALARPIAEGAWMRLRCGARCFDRYTAELRGGGQAGLIYDRAA